MRHPPRVMMTDPKLGSLDRPRTKSRPVARTGWWLPVTAFIVWLGYRRVDAVTAAGIATIGAAVFIAIFGLSVIRAAASRWWGGTMRAAPPPR
jgi:hypothetical protein